MYQKAIRSEQQGAPKLLGILGGLGPMASVYFCEMLISHTKALRDCDHINFLLSSRADTPDRSSFILGQSSKDPTAAMTETTSSYTIISSPRHSTRCVRAALWLLSHQRVRLISRIP